MTAGGHEGIPPRLCRLHHASARDPRDDSGAKLALDVRTRLTWMGKLSGAAGAVVVFLSIPRLSGPRVSPA